MRSLLRSGWILLLCALICFPVWGAEGETLYSNEYCFSREEFPAEAGGIFICSVPDGAVAVLRLGDRCIRPGDVLSADRLEELRLLPGCRENCEAALCYQPIFGNTLGEETSLVIRIRSGRNEAPHAEDGEVETYKNIPNNGMLKAADPEGKSVEFRLAEKPKRGEVKVKPDGSFVYTPSKNKVGEDSFTFIAVDEAGNESKPATVRIKILKPSDAMTFADMTDSPARFEAMWASNRGLTGGMEIGGRSCFLPNGGVSRGEFLVMAMELMEQKVDESVTTSAFADASQAAAWIRPYLACAVRKGVVRGEVSDVGLIFRPNDPITCREAAVILQNLLELPVPAAVTDSSLPTWAAGAVSALSQVGISLEGQQTMTREQVVCLLYQVSKLET